MKRWPWLIPLVAGVVAYAPAPWGALVWDDPTVIEYQLEPFRGLREVLRPPDEIPRWSYGYYRPVVVLSWLADERLFGAGAPAGPHVVNVAWHLLATLLVGALARRLLDARPGADAGAIAAATLFAVHPVHTESVSWIAGRSDVLATVFVLATLLVALAWRDGRAVTSLLLAPLLILLALLAKEIAIVGVALVVLLWWLAPAPVSARHIRTAHGSEPTPDQRAVAAAPAATRAIALTLGVAVAIAAYVALRRFGGVVPGAMPDLPWPERGARLLAAGGWYLLKLLQPWPQSAYVAWNDVPAWPASAAALGVMLGASGWALARWRSRRDAVPLAAALWWWLTLAPLLWIAAFAANNTPLAERYLYLPSVALALAVGAAVAAAWPGRRRAAALALAAGVAALAIAGSIARGLVWQDDLALWTDTTRRTAAGLPWMNLGFTLLAQGASAPAFDAFRRALDDDALEAKWQGRAHLGLGTILAARGEPAAAEQELRAAIAADPDYEEPYYRLGMLYQERAMMLQREARRAERDRAATSAIGYFSTATARRPTYHLARLALAGFLAEHARRLEAEGDAAQALRRYAAARDQLRQFETAGAGRPRDAGQRALAAAATGLDPRALARELDAAIARLGAAVG